MRTTWIVGIVMLYLLGAVISGTLELEYVGAGTTGTLFDLIQPDFASITNPLTAIAGFFIMLWGWIQALWKVFWWDYAFFTGNWEILKYFGWCVSIGIVVSLVLAVRGTGSS